MYVYINAYASILGGWGSRPPDFGWGLWGAPGGLWTGLGKHYSLFSTESMLESVFFIRKRERLAQNAGGKGENVMWIFMDKRQFFELRTKKGGLNFCLENRIFFGLESKISATGFTTPQTLNQIDATVYNKWCNHVETWPSIYKQIPFSIIYVSSLHVCRYGHV